MSPLLLTILFIALPLFAWFSLVKLQKSAKDANKSLVGALALIPIIVTGEYVASKVLGIELTQQEFLDEFMLIYVGFSLVLWLWFRLFLYLKNRRSPESQ